MKQVYEIEKEALDKLLLELSCLREAIEHLKDQRRDASDDWITIKEFGEKVNMGREQLYQLSIGSHPSGFHLKTQKRKGTRTVWVPRSEVDRWFSFPE